MGGGEQGTRGVEKTSGNINANTRLRTSIAVHGDGDFDIMRDRFAPLLLLSSTSFVTIVMSFFMVIGSAMNLALSSPANFLRSIQTIFHRIL